MRLSEMSPRERFQHCLELAEKRQLFILAYRDHGIAMVSDPTGLLHEVRLSLGGEVTACLDTITGSACKGFAYNGMCSHAALVLADRYYAEEFELALLAALQTLAPEEAEQRWLEYLIQIAELSKDSREKFETGRKAPLLRRAAGAPFSLWRSDSLW